MAQMNPKSSLNKRLLTAMLNPVELIFKTLRQVNGKAALQFLWKCKFIKKILISKVFRMCKRSCKWGNQYH